MGKPHTCAYCGAQIDPSVLVWFTGKKPVHEPCANLWATRAYNGEA